MIDHTPLIVAAEKDDMGTNRTGFAGLAASLRDGLFNLKREVSEVQTQMQMITSEGLDVVQRGQKLVDDAKREVAEARAALGLMGNGGPE